MRRVLFLRSNPVDPDPRVEKEALTLSKAGFSVTVLGWDRTASLPKSEEKEFGLIERLRIPARFGSGLNNLPRLLRFQLGLIVYLWQNRRKYDIIHACDFDTLLPALMAKILWRKRVVYDIFDFYADMILKAPTFLKQLVRRIDLWAMGLADGVILADEARLLQVAGAKLRRVAFVYNAPEARVLLSFSATPPSPPPWRVGYVGILSVTRGILPMIEVVAKSPGWVMELAGFGEDEEQILAAVRGVPKIRFHGRVPYIRGLEIAASSHVLFATYDPAIPNHRFSSANKLFEAMALGRPIIVARGTGMDRIVDKYGLGFVVDYGDVKQLEAVLHEVQNWNGEKWKEFSERARATFNELFSWEIQEHRLVALYHELASCFPWVRTG